MFLHLWMLKVKTWDTQHILFSVSSCSGLLSFRKIQLNEFILSQVPRPDYIGHTVVWYTKMWNINYKTKMWRRWLWYMKEAHLAEFSHQLSPHPTTTPHNFHEQLNVHCTTIKHPTTAPHITVNFHVQLNVHCTYNSIASIYSTHISNPCAESLHYILCLTLPLVNIHVNI